MISENNNLKELWEIHTFGTSFTKGGGFEFRNNPLLKEFYKNYRVPKIQFNFSWPGQLQEILHEDFKKTKVFNHAESGYGHEKTIRDCHKIILENKDNLHDKLFILEFGGFGRKDHHINELGYIISNYHFESKNNDFLFVVDDDDEDVKVVTHGIAKKYHEDDEELKNKIKNIEPIISNFNSETIEFKTVQNQMGIEICNFVGFLNTLGVNYLICSAPFMSYEHSIHFSKLWKGKRVIYTTQDGDKDFDMYGFLFKSKLRIEDETNGLIKDGHGGYKGNKEIAKQIYEKMQENYSFPSHDKKNEI